MATPFLNELKKQASFFFKDKIKTARLVLTDATPTQLMTEEATNGNSWPPDAHTFRVISRAAFDIDDYWRIVEILHKRLMDFDRENWRGSYKALILLEHLLTHGPLSVALEFQDDKETIKNMGSFQHIDEKGFNWGLSVKKLSARVLKLLEDEMFRKQERARAHNLTRGIQGFGTFNQRSSSNSEESLEFFASKTYGRCNSHYNDHGDQNQKTKFLASNGFVFVDEDGIGKKRHIDLESRKPEKYSDSNWLSGEDEYSREDHPFCSKNKHPLTDSLLSSVE